MKNLPKRVTNYVVIYDIFSEGREGWSSPSNTRRAKIARLLLEFGIRTQKSVFEIKVSSSEAKKLFSLLKKRAKEDRDKIYIYPLENRALKKIRRAGKELDLLNNFYL